MIYDGINTVPVIMDSFYPGARGERAYTQIRRALEDLRCDSLTTAQRDFGAAHFYVDFFCVI